MGIVGKSRRPRMGRFSLALLLAVHLSCWVPAAAADPQSIDLQEAIRRGATRPAQDGLRAEAQAQDLLASAARRDAFAPQLAVTGGIQHTSELATFNTPLGDITPGAYQQHFVQAGVRQPLLNWARMRYGTQAQQLTAESSSLTADRGTSTNGYGAALSYLAAASLQVRLTAAGDLRKSLDERLARAEALFHEGRVLEADVLQIKVRRDEVAQQIVSLTQDQRAASSELGQAVGSDEPLIPEAIRLTTSFTLPAEPDDLQAALSRRPDIAALERAAEALELKRKEVEAEQLPTLDASVAYDYRSGVPLFPSHDVVVGVQMTWVLVDGSRVQRSDALRQERRRLEDQLAEQRHQVATDLQRARADFNTARSQGELADSALTSARRTREMRSGLYEYGRSNIDEVLAAEAEVSGQQAQRWGADLEIVRAWLEYRLAAGLSLEVPRLD
jgi:outer membrane protein TolC